MKRTRTLSPRRSLLLATLLSAWLAGCGSTAGLTAIQVNTQAARGAPFQRILVLDSSQDEALRRACEEELVHALSAYGVNAMTLSNAPKAPLNVEQRQRLLAATGADAVLTTHELRRERRSQQDVDLGAAAPGVNQFNYALLQTELWSARDNTQVWSGTSEIVQPEHSRRAGADFAAEVGQALAQAHLLPRATH
jgi:hypothetical protein